MARANARYAKQPQETKSGKAFYTVSVDGRILGKKLASDREEALDAMLAKNYPGWKRQGAVAVQWKSGQYTIHRNAETLTAHVSL